MAKRRSEKTESVFIMLKELGKVLRFFHDGVVLCEGVTFIQFCVLDYVADFGQLEMSELHGLLSVEKSTTTRMVNPLVSRGLLVKLTSSKDSRSIYLALTAKGKDVHRKVWQCISGYIEGFLSAMPADRRDEIVDSIGVFTKSIRTCCAGKYK
jgi:DNA-binding MarR family transcriptional regulator